MEYVRCICLARGGVGREGVEGDEWMRGFGFGLY